MQYTRQRRGTETEKIQVHCQGRWYFMRAVSALQSSAVEQYFLCFVSEAHRRNLPYYCQALNSEDARQVHVYNIWLYIPTSYMCRSNTCAMCCALCGIRVCGRAVCIYVFINNFVNAL